ncbi:UDP-N-acetylmuramate dehydrogenase [Natrialbaceae archaeon A-CW2]
MKRATEPLAKHTWLKIGGSAEIAIPESKEEFVELLKECHSEGRAYRILGNGSNLLVSDDGINGLVIKNTEACVDINIDGNMVQVGASVAVPQFVNICVKHNLGGYEYLYSVPGTVGGAIFMNAGRGKTHNRTISDYLVDVEVFDGEKTRIIPKSNLDFEYRYSSFHDQNDWTILTAKFDLPSQPSEKGRNKVQKRMEKVTQRERKKPNAGTVFKSGNRLPLNRVPPNGLKIGDARFVHGNRICNDGDATYKDVKRLIILSKVLHRLIPGFKEPELEYEIWE